MACSLMGSIAVDFSAASSVEKLMPTPRADPSASSTRQLGEEEAAEGATNEEGEAAAATAAE